MDSVLELQRQTHEEIERFERGLYTLLSRSQPTHESKLRTQHRAAQLLDRISQRVTSLNDLYEDEESRKAEIEALSAPSNQNDLSEFYSRFTKLQEHHAKYPGAAAGGIDLETSALLEESTQDDVDQDLEEEDPISLLFSGEESYGKYLDLYANHTAYNNPKHINKRLGYLQYLDILLSAQSGGIHRELSKEARFTKDYENYIKTLHSYILSFTHRTMPLEDVAGQQQAAVSEFNQKWDAKQLEGWDEPDNKRDQAAGSMSGEGIWCPACQYFHYMIPLERMFKKLHPGQKHYAKQTVYDAHLTSKKHIKGAAKQSSEGVSKPSLNGSSAPTPVSTNTAKSRIKDSAEFTYLTSALLRNLVTVLNDTKSNVERRFSLTAREREQELLEQSKPPPPPKAENAEGEDEEEERIYNPLKLPLGWDGKPIPYWLYKLHGLGVEYRCEICSDHVYMGRKNFDRHFQESRHAFGMKALGLPNTKHFHEITKIDDALALAEKLKREGRHEIFEQETMEELEDDEGNVYNRKTYEDLKKQGLI